ncbi:HNH endonuclease [Caproicibacterium amylolyticum]|uniref:HNH endonuclease n=1 Tax=Caproicibacterium amylolyticum TaxID=2766537 RepID=A0A7G9WHP2_9FIRM|nr:HNH endonuclease [Caproicibacterium amylolyticum]MBE6721063.1 hypothetical protein [Oscillospiraceae bacterium]QNO18204.1 HNH endonuclease [Caproicibacterium amylolyticum]
MGNRMYQCTTLSSEEWKDVLSTMEKGSLVYSVVGTVYQSNDHRLNASAIAEILGVSHFIILNKQVGLFGRYIYDHYTFLNCPLRDNGEIRWWNIVFDGEDVFTEDNKACQPRCDWILKPEMLEAINVLKLFPKQGRKTAGTPKNLYKVTRMYQDIQHLKGKERECIIKARCNQGQIRKNALAKYHACELCGMKVQPLLVASHIKPWCDSNPDEKGDIDNIMLLCPQHDALFDRKLISFDEDGTILINSNIDDEDKKLLGIHEGQKVTLTERREAYMEYHRGKFYENNISEK